MKKLTLALLLVTSACYGQSGSKPAFVLNQAPSYKTYSPTYDGRAITIRRLNESGIKNLREDNLLRYQTLLGYKFAVSTASDVGNMLSKKGNINKVQQLVDQINRKFDDPFADVVLLGDNYPKAFFFRVPEMVFIGDNYQTWSREMLRLDGVFMKAQNEELSKLNAPRLAYYGNLFALDNPTKMVMLHYNGRSRDPYFECDRFFAGHWAYFPGTTLSRDIDPDTEWVEVGDTKVFAMGFGLQNANKNDDIVIVPLDDNGEKLWRQAEQTTLLEIGEGKIKLARGRYGTSAGSFHAGKTYLAAHVNEGPWGGTSENLMWYYNYSTLCPKDENGRTAADVLSDELAEKFSSSGILHSFAGIEFDISPFDVKRMLQRRYIDINNDGVGDGGVVDGVNVYGAGVHDFYVQLRRKMGDKKFIMADGVVYDCQRAPYALNGIEAEGLSWPHLDYYFNEFSRSRNVLTYWTEHFYAPGFSYITQKEQNAPDNYEKFGRMRVTVAFACCMGLGINSFFRVHDPESGFITSVPDEFLAGTDVRRNWLGKPIGPMTEMAIEGDLLQGAGRKLTPEFLKKIDPNGNHMEVNDQQVTLRGEQKKNLVFYLRGLENPSSATGDFLLTLRSKEAAPMPGQRQGTPRHIFAEVICDNNSEWLTKRQMGFVGCDSFNFSMFYFRDLGKGIYDLKIEVEDGGQITFTDWTTNNRPYVFYREFENGVVVGNISEKDFVFNPAKFFPGHKFKKISATKMQDTAYNDGGNVSGDIVIPGVNAIFLKKIK